MESELYKQNPWWSGKFKEESIKRPIYLDKINSQMNSKEIIFLTGLRRIGKTTLMKQTIFSLLEGGVSSENILFINLDTFIFLNRSIHDLIEDYRRIHKKSVKDKFYLFLDEITSKENFDLELKSLYDNDNVKIICSSSIATFMREKSARLTGRTITIEVMPLTFKEFLTFKKIILHPSDSSLYVAHFEDYLKIGGIPQFVLEENKIYLNELVTNIIYKDIIAHYNLKNEKIIMNLFILLCERVGKVMSYNKLSKILNISVGAVIRYVNYFENAYLFYVVDRYSKSPNEFITSSKKIYIGDVGIKNLITGFRDLGASYENLVFLKLKDENPKYHLEDSVEIDFRTKTKLVEAKYGQKLTLKQQKIFDSIIIDEKIVAQGVNFFK